MKKTLLVLLVLFTFIAKSEYINHAPNAVICDTFFVAENTELNIWYDALVQDSWEYDFKSSTSTNTVGITEDMERGFRYSPVAAQVGTSITLTIEIYYNGNVVQTLTTILTAISSTTGTGTAKWCLVGNSLIANSQNHIQVVNDSINTNTSITLTSVGLIGGAGYKREGYSGKTWTWFASDASSPFINGGVIDIGNWWTVSLSETGDLDAMIIQLGINDMFSGTKSQSDIDAVATTAKELCDSIISYFPNIKLTISLPSISSSRDGWGDDYGANSAYSQVQFERNMRNYWKTMLYEFETLAYSSNIDILMSGLTVDRLYGYPVTSEAISSRYSTVYDRQTNAVHPDVSGYQQLGDSWLGTLLNKLN